MGTTNEDRKRWLSPISPKEYVVGRITDAGEWVFEYDFKRIHNTVAHEIGHGIGALQHKDWRLDPENLMGTENLSPGAEHGIELRYQQWNQVVSHNPLLRGTIP